MEAQEKEKTVYLFNELSNEARERAINQYRNDSSEWLWSDLNCEYDFLLETLNDYQELCYQLEGVESDLIRQRAIEFVSIEKLDSYHGVCRVDVKFYDEERLLDLLLREMKLSKAREKAIRKVFDLGHVEVEGDYINNKCRVAYFNGNFRAVGALSNLVYEMDVLAQRCLEDVKSSIESFCIFWMRNAEEYLFSNEGISERLANDDFYQYDIEGNLSNE